MVCSALLPYATLGLGCAVLVSVVMCHGILCGANLRCVFLCYAILCCAGSGLLSYSMLCSASSCIAKLCCAWVGLGNVVLYCGKVLCSRAVPTENKNPALKM